MQSLSLSIADYSLSELSGMVLEDAELIWYFGGKKMRTGGILLFTHNGISGPAVLDISAAVARALSAGKAVKVKIKFFKELDAGSWDRILLTGSVDKGKKSVASCLAERLTRRCAELLLMLAGIPYRSMWAMAMPLYMSMYSSRVVWVCSWARSVHGRTANKTMESIVFFERFIIFVLTSRAKIRFLPEKTT